LVKYQKRMVGWWDGGQAGDKVRALNANLLQRELIESVEGGYRVQVELIRLWMVHENGL